MGAPADTRTVCAGTWKTPEGEDGKRRTHDGAFPAGAGNGASWIFKGVAE